MSEAELRNLWRRRAELTQHEWTRLYALVFSALSTAKCNDIVDKLPGPREEYIHDFFHDQVFDLRNNNRDLAHRGALVMFYRHYLIDRQKEAYYRRRAANSIGVTNNEDMASGYSSTLNDLSEQAQARIEKISLDTLLEHLEQMLGESDQLGEIELCQRNDLDRRQFLPGWNLKLSPSEAVRSAIEFITASDPWQAVEPDIWWIRLYLHCHFCAEKENRISLNALSRRIHRIPNYHEKALKLGITAKGEPILALDRFRDSLCGQWLQHLGIELRSECMEEVGLGLRVMCLVARSLPIECHGGPLASEPAARNGAS